mmetsp:Transcript_7709/g.13582  ORF Transcript_7709/g.13582 Transcript_7709/m.13582 type:complete len:265 (+) Transcript_7709:270-1064(+)
MACRMLLWQWRSRSSIASRRSIERYHFSFLHVRVQRRSSASLLIDIPSDIGSLRLPCCRRASWIRLCSSLSSSNRRQPGSWTANGRSRGSRGVGGRNSGDLSSCPYRGIGKRTKMNVIRASCLHLDAIVRENLLVILQHFSKKDQSLSFHRNSGRTTYLLFQLQHGRRWVHMEADRVRITFADTLDHNMKLFLAWLANCRGITAVRGRRRNRRPVHTVSIVDAVIVTDRRDRMITVCCSVVIVVVVIVVVVAFVTDTPTPISRS